MLELSKDNIEETLDEYRKLALEIDRECYLTIIEKIKNSNYNNLPLEEQIKVLMEFAQDYNYLNELLLTYHIKLEVYHIHYLQLI